MTEAVDYLYYEHYFNVCQVIQLGG